MDFGGDNVTLALLKRIKAYFCAILLDNKWIDDAYNLLAPGLVSEDPDWYSNFSTLREYKQVLAAYLANQPLSNSEQTQLTTLLKKVIPTISAN